MESLTTFDYLSRNGLENQYKLIQQSSKSTLKLPKTINSNYLHLYQQQQVQENNSYFYAKLNNITMMCGDNGISGTAFKTKEGYFLNDLNHYWTESCNVNKKIRYKLNNKVLSIASKWAGWNVFHYVLCALPKIAVYNDLGLKDQKIIHNSLKKHFVKESLELLNVNLDNVFCLDEYPIIEVEELELFSPIGYGVNGNKECCDILKFLYRMFLEEKQDKNIYIKRSNTRSIINEEELLKLIPDFKVVQLETLSFLEQIKLFSRSKNVIAPHGAGLTNLVWCKENTKVLELLPNTYMGMCFWLIADSCDLDYYVLVESGNSNNYWSDGSRSFRIDIEEFKKTLTLMELY